MNNKREALKKVAGVSAVVALAPTPWSKPILNSIVLPAHAQTSSRGGFFTQDVYNIGVTVTDDTNVPQDIIDLVTVLSSGRTSLGSILVWVVKLAIGPSGLEERLWTDSVQISSNVLQVAGLLGANPNESGEVSITIEIVDGKFGIVADEAVFKFIFSNQR